MNKNKFIKIIGSIMIFILILGIKISKFSNKGNSAKIDMNGTQIIVNETKVSDILGQGYSLTNSGIYEVPKTIGKKTYTDKVAAFNKDGLNYANISVANLSGSDEKIETCKIIEITFDYNDSYIMGKKINTYKDALINGFNPNGMTKEEIKNKISKEVKEEDKKLEYEDGDYYCRYYFDDEGNLNSVTVGISGTKLK